MSPKYLITVLSIISLFSIAIKVNAFGVATTSTTTTSAVFIDWHPLDNKIIFDVDIPGAGLGDYLFLKQGSKTIASSSLGIVNHLVIHKTFSIIPKESGTYDFTAYLCKDISGLNCAKSIPASIVIKGSDIFNEIDLRSDDISEARFEILTANIRARALRRLESNMARYGYSLPNKNLNTFPNVERAKGILNKSSLMSVFTNIDDSALSDFYFVIENNPRFCGEAKDEESLDNACKRDLAAFSTYMLYFSNKEVKNEYMGIKDKILLKSFVKNSTKINLEESSTTKDSLTAIMDWYMNPKSPEPDPHSSLLGLFTPNKADWQLGIRNGFGSTINIASHGLYCNEISPTKDKDISSLYTKLLTKVGIVDNDNVSCKGQGSFTVGGAAYLPEYYSYDKASKECKLGVLQTAHSIYDKEWITECGKAPNLKIILSNGLDSADEVVALSRGITKISLLKKEIDKRVTFGRKISATYNSSRARNASTQPSLIPFDKINEIIYDSGYISASSTLAFDDKYIANEMPFAGDCLRNDCERGVINQLKIAKQKFPHLDVILSISILDSTNIGSSFAREKFVTSVEDFLKKNNQFTGIQIKIATNNKEIISEPLRLSIVGLRSLLSSMNSMNGNRRTLTLSLPAKSDIISNINFGGMLSMFDNIYLLAYDNHSTDEPLTSHNAQIFSFNNQGDNISLAGGLLALKKEGVLEKNIVIGVPLFGREWSNVEIGSSKDLPGIFAKHGISSSNTYLDYSTIVNYLLGRGGYQYYKDIARGASYIYDGENLVSYDTPEIIEQKMGFIYKDGYKGIMLADIMADNGDLTEKALNVISKGEQKLTCSIKRSIKTNIKDGVTNADVFALQSYLKCLGYFPSHIDVNGYFGAITKEAIYNFQKDNSLDPTGLVNDKTRLLLQPKS